VGTGIYISRLHGDLQTEAALYQQVIKVFRSPEMMLYLTEGEAVQFRPKDPSNAPPDLPPGSVDSDAIEVERS